MITPIDQEQFTKQMVELQKTMVDSSLKSLSLIQKRMEKILDMILNQSAWFSEKWNSNMVDYTNTCQKSFETLKTNMDSNFNKMENYITVLK
ncbi:putative Phasin domain-containing protein [Candidatus Magnetomoraceae bacterium gMMP-15]